MSWQANQLAADKGRRFRWPWERHNIDKMALWASGQDIGEPVDAGVFVSQESALQISAVYRCVQLISGTIAGLPIDIIRKRGAVREEVDRTPAWVDMPNPESTVFEFVERVAESLLMDGNAFILITARDALGFPSELWTLNPRSIVIKRENGAITFVWNGDTRLSRYGPQNPTGDVLHIRLNSAGGLRGLSPLDLARQAIGTSRAAEKFGGRFFGRGQTLSGVITIPQEAGNKTQEYIDLIRANWEAKHAGTDNSHRPGILSGGATWQSISVTPENAQFMELRKFQVEDIGRFYGVPAHMLGLEEKNTSWGTGIEAQSTGFVRFVLQPHIDRLEDSFSLLIPRGQFVKFNVAALLRADVKTETEVLNSQLERGVIDWEEYRALLDRPPRTGDTRRLLLPGMQVLPPNAAPPPAPPPTQPPAADGGAAA